MGNSEGEPSSVEKKGFVSLALTIRDTRAWEEWSKYCSRKLLDQSDKAREMIEAQLGPVPPDTYSSLRRTLVNGGLGATFEDFVGELQKQDDTIVARVQRSNSFGGDNGPLRMWIHRGWRE